MSRIKYIGLTMVLCLLVTACNSITPTIPPEPDSNIAEPPAQEETVLQVPITVEPEEIEAEPPAPPALAPEPELEPQSELNGNPLESDVQVDMEWGNIENAPPRVVEVFNNFLLGGQLSTIDAIAGISPVVVASAYDGSPQFRYDLFATPGYYFMDTHDNVDVDGLMAGHLEAVVFARFNEQMWLESFSVFFVSQGDLSSVRVWAIPYG